MESFPDINTFITIFTKKVNDTQKRYLLLTANKEINPEVADAMKRKSSAHNDHNDHTHKKSKTNNNKTKASHSSTLRNKQRDDRVPFLWIYQPQDRCLWA